MWSVDIRNKNDASVTCRGCLSVGVKLYNIHENRLVENYVQLVGVSDGLSQQLCSVCGALLRKLAAFRERCRTAHQLLLDADLQGKCITTYLEEIDIYTYSRLLKLPYVQSETQTHDYIDSDDAKIEALDFKQEIFIEDSHEIKREDSDLDREDITLAFVVDEIKEKKKAKVKMKRKKKEIKEEDLDRENKTIAHILDELNENTKPKTKHKKKEIKNKSPTTREETIEYAKSFEFDVKFLSKEEQFAEIEEKKKQKSKRAGTQCEYCGKNFTNQEKLNAHYDRDHEPRIGKFVCKICYCRFPYSSRLSRHLQTHRVTFQCQTCAATTKRHDTLQYHYLSHKGKKHTCQFCQKVFGKITTYFSHVRLVHASELPWCELCGESFINERGIKFHKSRVHKSEMIATLSCGDCGCKFSSQEAHDRHAALKRCDLVSCARCGEGFSTAQLLKYHLIQRHRTDTPLLDCNACGVVFLNAAARRRHAGEHDATQARCGAGAGCGAGAACVQCGDSFPSEQLLAEHVRAEHAGETFKCEECDKTFSNAFYYRDHFVRMHRGHDERVRRGRGGGARAGRRPRGGGGGGAEGAGRAAARTWRPSGPRAVVSADAARPPALPNAVCEVCGKAFQCVARLEAHLRTHSAERAHVCAHAHCAKAFRTPMALECHLRVHTGERPFQCKLCPKAFKMQPGLLRHQLVHSGVRKHVCQVCQKAFQTSSSVKLHIRSVHMKIPAPPRARRRPAAPRPAGVVSS